MAAVAAGHYLTHEPRRVGEPVTRRTREAWAKAHPYWVAALVCAFAPGMALLSLATRGRLEDYGVLSVVATLAICSVIGFAVLAAMLKRWASRERA